MPDPVNSRRKFIVNATLAGAGLAAAIHSRSWAARPRDVVRIGIIGLDTEHSAVFSRIFNDPAAGEKVAGFRVVAAYPYGSKEIEFSKTAIPRYTEEVKKAGVEIVDNIDALLSKCDAVLLETNDGRLHLGQALPVIRSRKPVFIDKPVAASLADALLIYEAAEKNSVPVFSASSLRFISSIQNITEGKQGAILGADIYSPALIEKTHPDLFMYGIHGVEMLFAIMGNGCTEVTRFHTESSDVVVGKWGEQRTGTYRGIRNGTYAYGGIAIGAEKIFPIGTWESYQPLAETIARFFRTGISPVPLSQTLGIIAFMEAAQESSKRSGATIKIADTFGRAEKYNRSRKRSSL